MTVAAKAAPLLVAASLPGRAESAAGDVAALVGAMLVVVLRLKPVPSGVARVVLGFAGSSSLLNDEVMRVGFCTTRFTSNCDVVLAGRDATALMGAVDDAVEIVA